MRKRFRNVHTRGKRVMNSYNQMVSRFAYSQTTNDWKQWNGRTISLREALKLVADGDVSPVTREVDGIVTTVGYQDKQATSRSGSSPCSLTSETLEAVTNAVGHKPRLTPSEEDEIFKFKVWGIVGDSRAPLTGPRLSVAERAEAEKLLPFAHPVRRLKLRAIRPAPRRMQQAA